MSNCVVLLGNLRNLQNQGGVNGKGMKTEQRTPTWQPHRRPARNADFCGLNLSILPGAYNGARWLFVTQAPLTPTRQLANPSERPDTMPMEISGPLPDIP